MQGVGGDHRVTQVADLVEQRREPGDLTGKTTVSGQAAASGRSPDEVLNLSVGCGAGQAGLS
ncbi:hypothetical protein ACN27F_16450 [Solwaraspora sp. WMMB335]|uniref:hypothetical protein n=1 Tax=Solwaraspora sp. WMMB335 TaxID=3404118 RepID=UPI003B95E3E7